MNCKAKRSILEEDHWNTWPSEGNQIKIDCSLKELESCLKKNASDRLYYYVVDTADVGKDSRGLYNTGSGPNFQGGLITLCTCKHSMRATSYFDQSTWVAGVVNLGVSQKLGLNNNLLFYLGKVKHIFHHYGELIDFLKKENPKAFLAKNACNNIRGDIFQPKRSARDFHDPEQYKYPCRDHVHNPHDSWKEDISYFYRDNPNKRSKYLMFDEEKSFAWCREVIQIDRGKVYPNGRKVAITSGYKSVRMKDFLDILI
ncbi:MAG TPA: hypothetical protein PKH14_04495 [Syntrophorhabdus sp.]|nr:hypothetical protein [Syntrophorhabdus sp.]